VIYGVMQPFTIATCAPNDLMRGIHDRMPVIIQRKDETAGWIPPPSLTKLLPLLIQPN